MSPDSPPPKLTCTVAEDLLQILTAGLHGVDNDIFGQHGGARDDSRDGSRVARPVLGDEAGDDVGGDGSDSGRQLHRIVLARKLAARKLVRSAIWKVPMFDYSHRFDGHPLPL